MTKWKHILFGLFFMMVFSLAVPLTGFAQVKPYTGGPNSNGTASVFFSVDGSTMPAAHLNFLQNDEFTLRAYIDLRSLSGTDGSGNPISVSLSSMQLVIQYDPSILQLENPTLYTTSCTDPSLNPIFQGASGRFSGCTSYSFGLDSSGNFSPNSTGIISLLSYTSSNSGLPSGLVELPAFKFKVQNVTFTNTTISLNPAAPSPTAFAAAFYAGDNGINFTSTDLVVAKAPTPGTGTVSLSGGEQSGTICGIDTTGTCPPQFTYAFFDSGTISVTVNGFVATVPYSQGSTNTSIVASLRDYFNFHTDSPVLATVSGTVLTLTSKSPAPIRTIRSLRHRPLTQTISLVPLFSVTPSGSALAGGS